MTKAAKLNVAQIDTIRAETLNALDQAREHLAETAYAAALPGGDEKAMLKASEAVQSYELKVQGLLVARGHAVAQEQQDQAERDAAERRVNAAKVRIVAAEYGSHVTGMSAALSDVFDRIALAEQKADHLRRIAFSLSDNDQDIGKAQNALVHMGAFGTANLPSIVKEALKATPDFYPYMVGATDRGLSILANIVPEINDPAVIAEAESQLDAQALADYKQTAAAAVAKGEEMATNLVKLGEG